MKHVMIDLETLGTTPDSVFLSIAAVQFDPETGKTGNELCINVDLQSSLNAGRKIDANTIKWWLQQRPEVMKLMFVEPMELTMALTKLRNFIQLNGLTQPWGNSAAFDLGMLTNAYHLYDSPTPWLHWNENCFRTFKNRLPVPKPEKNEAAAHNPLYDCHYQIGWLHQIYKKYNLKA